MSYLEIETTGSRLVGAITPLGHIGPKHHGIVIGRNIYDNKIYVAESCHTGYRLVPQDDFIRRYTENGPITATPNDGRFSNTEVAMRALNEITNGGIETYNLFTNNCESFANRAIHNHSSSQQVANTIIAISAIGIAALIASKSAA